MSPQSPGPDLERLERAWALPCDASPLQRALAYRPQCGAAWQYRNRVVAILCREQGLPLPWLAAPPSDSAAYAAPPAPEYPRSPSSRADRDRPVTIFLATCD